MGFRLDVAGSDDGLDVAAYVEVTFDLNAYGISGGGKVFENYVNDVLVEDLYVAK